MLTSSEITRVLAHYDLGTAEGIAATGHGFVNETAVVVTACGRFVVRRNHHRFSLAALQYRHRLIDTLCRRSFPTARLIPARDGSTLVMMDGDAYEVLEYVDGADFDPQRPGQIAAIGAILARYHQAVGDLEAPGNSVLSRYEPTRISALTETLYQRDVMGELHDALAWYDGRAAMLRAVLPADLCTALPHVLIHGDMHPDNVRFVGDRVAALLDFDQVECDARIVDLADAVVGFASMVLPSEATTWGVFRGPLNVAQAIALVDNYGCITPLQPSEVAALPVLIEVLWLRSELGRVISTPEGAPDYHAAVLAQGKRLSAWMQQHSARLLEGWNKAITAQPGALAA